MKKLKYYIEYIKIKYNKLISWLLCKPTISNEQTELFESLKPGDIVFASMPFSDRVMASIEKGHRNRPYLVVGKENDRVLAYPCSHKKRKGTSKRVTYCLSKDVYKWYSSHGIIKKSIHDSWISLEMVHRLPIQNLHYKSMSINEHDKKQIERKIVMIINQGKRLARFNCAFDIAVGDIVSKGNKRYYVYQVDKDFLFGNLVNTRGGEDSYKVQTGGATLYIHVGQKEQIKLDESCVLTDSVIKEDIQAIEQMKKDLKSKRKVKQRNEERLYNMYFKHAPGTMLHHQFNDEYIVYLYSVGGRNYGVYYDEFCEGYNIYRKFDYNKYFNVEGQIDDEEFTDMIEGLIQESGSDPCVHNFKYIHEHYCAQQDSSSLA